MNLHRACLALLVLAPWLAVAGAGAVGYGLLMTVNLSWPRAGVYDPAGGHWYFQWFTVLFVGATIAAGVLCRRRAPAAAAAGEPGRTDAAEAAPV